MQHVLFVHTATPKKNTSLVTLHKTGVFFLMSYLSSKYFHEAGKVFWSRLSAFNLC